MTTTSPTTTSPTTTTKSAVRKFDREVVALKPMKSGLSLDFGYADPAYLASSVYDGPIVVGDRVAGNYRLEEGRAGSRFARILEVSNIDRVVSQDEPIEEPASKPDASVRKFDALVESAEVIRTGLRLGLGYDHPAYLAGSVYDGDVEVGDRLSGSYRMEDGRDGSPFARILEIEQVERLDSPEPAEELTSASDGSVRKFDAPVEAVERIRTGLRLDLGYDHPAYLAGSVYDGEVKAGDRLTGSYRMEEGREGSPFARILDVEQIVSPDESAGESSAPVEAKSVTLLASAGIRNNRFLGKDANGKEVVVKATGRSVMFARSVVKKGARVMVTGAYNKSVEGPRAYFDAFRVEKAA